MKLFGKNLLGKGAKKHPKKERSQRIITPERDWKVIFTVFVLLNLSLFVFHGFLFFTLSRGGFFSTPEPEPVVVETINRELLESTLDYFSEQESALVENLASPDPAPSVQ